MKKEAEAADLREAVEAQARALTADDLAGFASFALPEALTQLYRSMKPGKIRAYDILSIDVASGQGRSEVRFRGTRDFSLLGSWERTAPGWRATTFEVSPGSSRESLLRRVLRLGRSREQVPQREDLS